MEEETFTLSWTKRLKPEDAAVIYHLAFTAYEHGRYEEALPAFRYLTTLCPDKPTYWKGLAACEKMLKHYEEALDAYQVSALLDPGDPFVPLHAADCLFALDKIERALLALGCAEKLAEKAPAHVTLKDKIKLMRQTWKTP